MKEKIIKILFSISAGLGLSVIILFITAFVSDSLGADEDFGLIIISLVEGTIAFGVLSAWFYNKLKK